MVSDDQHSLEIKEALAGISSFMTISWIALPYLQAFPVLVSKRSFPQ
jgi:hypothetical protein